VNKYAGTTTSYVANASTCKSEDQSAKVFEQYFASVKQEIRPQHRLFDKTQNIFSDTDSVTFNQY